MNPASAPIEEPSLHPSGVVHLSHVVTAFAHGLMAADSLNPTWVSASGRAYSAGIGPHTEAATITLVLDALSPSCHAAAKAQVSVPYPCVARQRCDVVLPGQWALEFKLLRFLGDNGKQNGNMLTHILSPYPSDRSALTDCDKLAASGFPERRAIVIWGYDYERWPMDPAIEAFELLAERRQPLGPRVEATFAGLVHPVHAAGRVFAWELVSRHDQAE